MRMPCDWLTGLAISITTLAGCCAGQTDIAERMDKLVQPYADAQVFMGRILVGPIGSALLPISGAVCVSGCLPYNQNQGQRCHQQFY